MFTKINLGIIFSGLLLVSVCVFGKGNVEAGAELAATCAACHGADGNSIIPMNPSLAGQNQKYFTEQMYDFKKGKAGGRYNPVMQSFANNLSQQQIEDLAAYFASQTIKPGKAKEQYVALGQRIYRGGLGDQGLPACSGCHGPRGEGNAEAGFPALGGQKADYIVAQLKAYKDGSRQNDINGIMRGVAQVMTPEQIMAVASYIEGLH